MRTSKSTLALAKFLGSAASCWNGFHSPVPDCMKKTFILITVESAAFQCCHIFLFTWRKTGRRKGRSISFMLLTYTFTMIPLNGHIPKANNPVPSLCFCMFNKRSLPCNFFLFYLVHIFILVSWQRTATVIFWLTRATTMGQKHNYVTHFPQLWAILCSNPHFIYWLVSAEHLPNFLFPNCWAHFPPCNVTFAIGN